MSNSRPTYRFDNHNPEIDPQLHDGNFRPGSTDPTHRPTTDPIVSLAAKISAKFSKNVQEKRVLPSPNVTEADFTEAYITFILYCNPSVPLSTSSVELRSEFETPPKSDGKTFSTFHLFQLIRKLEEKELKTWAELALELGVEPPQLDKGQSAQKVQQYAVRLKRWMHAMHIDAFFEYLMNRTHSYFTQIPSLNEPQPEERDGVPPKEDLALRALFPETKPKRGRRKAEDRDRDNDIELEKSPAQRPRILSPTLSDDFAIARAGYMGTGRPANSRSFLGFESGNAWPSDIRSAHPGSEYTSRGADFDKWPARDFNASSFQAYPKSAVTPRTLNPFLTDPDEPQSAITPSKANSKWRRRRVAVSSAWPAGGGGSSGTGRIRGRPPSNRNISDGPFSTFPVNPGQKTGPTIQLSDATPSATPTVENDGERFSAFPFPEEPTWQGFRTAGSKLRKEIPNNASADESPHDATSAQEGAITWTTPISGHPTRPGRLHLQVPERVGAPVRLATPPLPQRTDIPTGINSQGNILGNPAKPAGSGAITEDRTNVDAVEVACTQVLLSADWVDKEGEPTDRAPIREIIRLAKQVIVEVCNESEDKAQFILSLSVLAGASKLISSMKIARLSSNETTTRFGFLWIMKFGAIEANYNKTVYLPHAVEEDAEEERRRETGPGRNRYTDMAEYIKSKDDTIDMMRKSLVEALAASDQYAKRPGPI